MVCSEHHKHVESYHEVKVEMAEVKYELQALKENQDVFLEEFREFVKSQKEDIEKRVSWRTFSLIVLLAGTIISAVYINLKELDAKVNEFKVSLQHCVFK